MAMPSCEPVRKRRYSVQNSLHSLIWTPSQPKSSGLDWLLAVPQTNSLLPFTDATQNQQRLQMKKKGEERLSLLIPFILHYLTCCFWAASWEQREMQESAVIVSPFLQWSITKQKPGSNSVCLNCMVLGRDVWGDIYNFGQMLPTKWPALTSEGVLCPQECFSIPCI